VKVAMMADIASSGTNWMATMVESGTKPGSAADEQFSPTHSVRIAGQQHDEAQRQR